MARWLLNLCKDGDFTISLGNLCQCSVTVTKYFLESKWIFMCSDLCPLPLVLLLGTIENSLSFSSSFPSITSLHTLGRSPQGLHFSGMSNISRNGDSLRMFGGLSYAESQLKKMEGIPLALGGRASLTLDPRFSISAIFSIVKL